VDAAKVDTVTASEQGWPLDPFAFFAGARSRIAGLAEGGPCPDPTYVFHTLYVDAPHGPASFKVQFEGLTASCGNLVVRVHGLSVKPGSRAQLINSERIPLKQLASQAGKITIAFESIRGMTYAVVGLLADDTDARASSLGVCLDASDISQDPAEPIDIDPTSFSADKLEAVPFIISLAEPTLTHPVSQRCTPNQFKEDVYSHWLSKLGAIDGTDPKQWEHVFILQALDRYGLLRRGARGLGFSAADAPLPAIIASHGISVVTTDIASHERERAANFDFVWSASVLDKLGSVAAGSSFVERAMTCVRPGGLVVHTADLETSPAIDQRTAEETAVFRPRDVERLALTLISRGHEVAQLKLYAQAGDMSDRGKAIQSGAAGEPITSFGFIVRRSQSPL
jgi:hypothetical protein